MHYYIKFHDRVLTIKSDKDSTTIIKSLNALKQQFFDSLDQKRLSELDHNIENLHLDQLPVFDTLSELGQKYAKAIDRFEKRRITLKLQKIIRIEAADEISKAIKGQHLESPSEKSVHKLISYRLDSHHLPTAIVSDHATPEIIATAKQVLSRPLTNQEKEDILHGPRWQVIYFTADYDDELISYVTHHSDWQIAHDTALLPEVN